MANDKEHPFCLPFLSQIALVQFLLENCLEIFGEDVLSLGNKSSMSGDSREEASGSLNHGTDFGKTKAAEHIDSSCPSWRTCPKDTDAVPRSHLLLVAMGGSQEAEGFIYS